MRHEAQADVAAALAPMPPLMPQYSLATLFFSITWIAVCLGALKFNACLGMLLIFLTMPALLRTLALGVRDQEAGIVVTPGKRLRVFFASLGIMFLVLIVSGGVLAGSAWVSLVAAAGDWFPFPIHAGISIGSMTFGIAGSFAAAAGILWYTRWLGA
ncbi:MAG TPA: hypothetical protein VMP01_26050 [Pirellulaceae bacterium]|nr:hypothetical protein [Pirellulaceae bacterium]